MGSRRIERALAATQHQFSELVAFPVLTVVNNDPAADAEGIAGLVPQFK